MIALIASRHDTDYMVLTRFLFGLEVVSFHACNLISSDRGPLLVGLLRTASHTQLMVSRIILHDFPEN